MAAREVKAQEVEGEVEGDGCRAQAENSRLNASGAWSRRRITGRSGKGLVNTVNL
jgi:hypothetical protein